MKFEALSDWLEWLELQHPKDIDLGLERIGIVAARLNVDSLNATVITVAGTNGKGSFVASLAAILRAHGQCVACYTSPHLLCFNERIDLDGFAVSDEALVLAFEKVYECCQGISLTYFEFTTLAAFYLFRQQQFDVIILEVGLGGRLDAVNIIAPDYAVITSIGIDHQEYLGNSREQIAFEKCGILRSGTPLISAEVDPPAVLQQALDSHPAMQIGKDFRYVMQGDHWDFVAGKVTHEPISVMDNGLSAPSQSAAIYLAWHMLGADFRRDLVRAVLNSCSLPGRFQKFVKEGITIILDVAHNPQAAEMLASRLQALPLPEGNRRMAVFSMLRDKDAGAVIHALGKVFDQWFIGEINHRRASKREELSRLFTCNSDSKVNVSDNMQQAFEIALGHARPGDQMVVFGSFYVVAEFLPMLAN